MPKFNSYQDKSLFYGLIHTHRILEKTMESHLKKWGLGLPASFCLVAIFFEDLEDKTLTSADLVKMLDVTKGHISQLTIKLIEQKYIHEIKKVEDRRKSYWAITDKGWKASHSLIVAFNKIEESLEKSVPNQAEFLSSLKSFRKI